MRFRKDWTDAGTGPDLTASSWTRESAHLSLLASGSGEYRDEKGAHALRWWQFGGRVRILVDRSATSTFELFLDYGHDGKPLLEGSCTIREQSSLVGAEQWVLRRVGKKRAD